MMRFARAFLVVVFGTACLALAGPASAQTKPQPRVGQVYLLRGLANIFSLGMDDLARKLNERGIPAAVYPYTEWKTLATSAAARSRQAGGKGAPVIIIGHSLGADAAVYMANRVVELGAPVPLVVTFDPVTPTVASPAIGKVVNYYQAGGSGKPVSGARVSNVDLTRTGGLSHFNIEKAANLHEQVIAMIMKPTAPAARKPRPKPATPPASTITETDTPTANPVSANAPAPAASAAAATGGTDATPAASPAAASAPAVAEPRPAAPM